MALASRCLVYSSAAAKISGLSSSKAALANKCRVDFSSRAAAAAAFCHCRPLKMMSHNVAPIQCATDDDARNTSPIVSVDWLQEHLKDPHLKVLDASWYMPAEKRKPLEEFTSRHIPGALFFDIDAIADASSELPHMLPSEAAFSSAMSCLGLENGDTVVVYDGKGIFSAARAWWMFRVFGHDKAYVLDGGLPRWLSAGYPVETSTSDEVVSKIRAAGQATKSAAQSPSASFKAAFQNHLVWSLEQVRRNLDEGSRQLVDARSKPRFDGLVPEPRQGVRSGHIPGSKCVPFTDVLADGSSLLPPDVLANKFKDAGVSLDAPIVTSCGTGVTACILALALHRLGREDVPVYDGSWTEWGGSTDVPIEKVD